jgi:hypothetical protein
MDDRSFHPHFSDTFGTGKREDRRQGLFGSLRSFEDRRERRIRGRPNIDDVGSLSRLEIADLFFQT